MKEGAKHMKRKRIIIAFIVGVLLFLCLLFLRRPQRCQGHITACSLDGEVLELELDLVLYKNRLHIGAGEGIVLIDKLYGTIVIDGQTYWSEWDLWDERNLSIGSPKTSYMFFTRIDSLFRDPAYTYIIMDMEPGFQNMSFWVIRKNGEDTMYYVQEAHSFAFGNLPA